MEAKLQELMDAIVHTKGAKGGHLRADISTEEGGQDVLSQKCIQSYLIKS